MIMCVKIVKEGDTEFLFTGSSDGEVKMARLNLSGGIDHMLTLDIGVTPRSVDFMQNTLLVGFSDGSIKEFQVNGTKDHPKMSNLIESHFDGETWGLCMINEKVTQRYVTSGDDNILHLYDIKLKKVIGRGYVDVTQKTVVKQKGQSGGASTQSKYSDSQ
jgi:hypothetical protein